MTRSRATTMVVWLLLNGALAISLSACVSNAVSQMPLGATATEPMFFTGLPPIPLDQPLNHVPADISQTIQVGSDAIAKSAGASISGTELILSAAAGAFEFGMYAFAPGAATLKSIKASFSVSAGNQVWIGIANYGPKRWQFKGPYSVTGTAQFDGLDTGLYLSQGGSCYLLIVSYDATTADVSTIEFTTDDSPPAFSLSGNVALESSGAGLSGVILTLEPGGATATSDSAGDYYFAAVTAGQYTLTPTLAGYTFSPEYYNLNLNGLATDVDFSAIPSAAP